MAQVKDLIVSGASRFLNTINGTITNSEKLNGQSLTSTYSSSGVAPVTGTAVASALGTLDGTVSGSAAASKTLTAFSQTDGKVSATFGNIAIANTQVSGLGTASTKDVASSGNASTTQVVMGNDTRLSDARTPSSHTHGNIQNGGTLQTNDITIASGDKLVVTDSSDSSKIARTSISFDGSTTTQCLTKKGTWATFGTSNLAIGTTASTAMAGNTNVNNVTQNVLSTTGTSSYKILLSGSADASAHTEGVYKYSTLEFTPDNEESVFDGNTLSMYNNSWETVIRLSCGTKPYVYVKDSTTTCLKAYNSYMIIENNINNPTKYVQSGLDSTDSTPYILLRDETSAAIYSWSQIKPEEVRVAKSQVGSMSIQPTDIVTGNTWDGTNTSLVTAIKNCVRCRQVQFSITAVNITKNTNATILSQYNLKTSTATDLFSNQTLKALFGSTNIVGAKCTWINGGTALARDELIESGGLYTLGVYCTSLGGSTVNTVRLLVWYTL